MATKITGRFMRRLLIGAAAMGLVTISSGAWAQEADGAMEEGPQEEEKIEDAEAEEKPFAGYKKGFFIQDSEGKFKLKVNAKMQPQFAFESVEAHKVGTDSATGEEVILSATDRESEYAFLIRRAELKLSGHALTDMVRYEIMADFAKGNAILQDFNVDLALVENVFHLKVGQWKAFFSRQQMTSSGKLELVDRSITDKPFAPGRDLGIALHNNYSKSPAFEWAVGVVNGTGNKPWFSGKLDTEVDEDTGEESITGISSKSKFTNVPDRFNPMAVVRLGYNHGDLKGYSEADLEGGPLRFGVGLSGLADFDSDEDDDSNLRGELDFILKVHGFSLNAAGYVMTVQDGDGFGDQAFGAWGVHAQAGYVFKDLFQPVVRYALVDYDGDYNNIQEITGGISVYVFGHKLKWQTDVGGVTHEDADGDVTDILVRSQLTLGF